MPTVVDYPVEITHYKVFVRRTTAVITLQGTVLQGVEGPVGRITFGDPNPRDFINRGGFLEMSRPLTMLSGILDLLRNEKPLFLGGDGTLSTSTEPAGEEEEEQAG